MKGEINLVTSNFKETFFSTICKFSIIDSLNFRVNFKVRTYLKFNISCGEFLIEVRPMRQRRAQKCGMVSNVACYHQKVESGVVRFSKQLFVAMRVRVGLFGVYLYFSTVVGADESVLFETNCSTLLMGQYVCPDPSHDYIDPKTQQPFGCTEKNLAKVRCRAADGITCKESGNSTFEREMPCKWTNGYSFETAMLLSVFLGMFGADRFYLGYPAIGLLKLCTLGFMFMGQLLDIILIATQRVGPADGSHYVIPYYGAGIEIVRSNNWTFKLPQDDW